MIRTILTLIAISLLDARDRAMLAWRRHRAAAAERQRAHVQAWAEGFAVSMRDPRDEPCDHPDGCDAAATHMVERPADYYDLTYCAEHAPAGAVPIHVQRRPCSEFRPSGPSDPGRCGCGYTEGEHARVRVFTFAASRNGHEVACGAQAGKTWEQARASVASMYRVRPEDVRPMPCGIYGEDGGLCDQCGHDEATHVAADEEEAKR